MPVRAISTLTATAFVLLAHGAWAPAEARQIAATFAQRSGEMVPNFQVDPGEGIEMQLCLSNQTSVPVANVMATLLNADGVSRSSGTQSYGSFAPFVGDCRLFTFKANGTCGSAMRANFRIDPPGSMVAYAFPIGAGGLVESFDAVSPGQLPPNIFTFGSGVSQAVVTAAAADTAPHSIFMQNPATASDNYVLSRFIDLPPGPASLTFRHSFATEPGWDGAVLEISTNLGAYEDILAAGGSFVTGGYNNTLISGGTNVLAGRSAWTGNSGGFITTTVQLPSSPSSRQIQFRWRFGTDASVSATGWYIDSIATSNVSCAPVPADAPWRLKGTVSGSLASFQWLPPLDVVPEGYRLEASLDGGATFPFALPLGPFPSFVGNGPDATVQVRIRSRLAGGGLSPPSNTVTAEIGAAARPPGVFTFQKAVQGSTVGLAWTMGPVGGTLLRNLLAVGTTPGASDIALFALPPDQTTLLATDVPPGTYHLQLRPVGPLLLGVPSNPIVVTVPGTCAPPAAPLDLNATVVGRVLTVTWSLNNFESDSPAPTSWTIEAGTSGGLANLAVLNLGRRSISAPVPPGTYFIRVSAANMCGASPKSNEISVTVQ